MSYIVYRISKYEIPNTKYEISYENFLQKTKIVPNQAFAPYNPVRAGSLFYG